MPPNPNAPRHGHVRIEIVETRDLLLRRRWSWRTVTIRTGEKGVRSEPFTSLALAERSIKAHRNYLATCGILYVEPNGKRRDYRNWSK